MKKVEFTQDYKKGKKLLFLKGENCPLCEAMLEKTEKELKQNNIEISILKLEDHPKLRGQYMVFSYPTLLLLKDGKEIDRQSGYFDFERVKKWSTTHS